MGRSVRALICLAVLAPLLASAQSQMRMAFVSVTSRSGFPVPTLTAADFDVSVGGVTQRVTRVAFGPPVRVVLLVDASEPVAQLLNHFRAGLNAFLDALPADDEVALLSIGGHLNVLQAPTTDRRRLRAAADRFRSDGGNNAFLDSLLESDKRFLKNAHDRWPVFAILTTDHEGTASNSRDIDLFNAFVQDFVARGGSAHALVLHGRNSGLISDLAQNLVENTGGSHDGMAISNALPAKMKALAERIATDQQVMANRYEIQYFGSAKAGQPVEIRVPRNDVMVQMSLRRPF